MTNKYYFVLTDPNTSRVSLSLYFTTYKEALEYAKSMQDYNPKIVEYDCSVSNLMMYDNILAIL
jgi:hypothetical protein